MNDLKDLAKTEFRERMLKNPVKLDNGYTITAEEAFNVVNGLSNIFESDGGQEVLKKLYDATPSVERLDSDASHYLQPIYLVASDVLHEVEGEEGVCYEVHGEGLLEKIMDALSDRSMLDAPQGHRSSKGGPFASYQFSVI